MLTADNLYIQGRHTDLVPATSFEAPTGEVTLVRGEDQSTRTALALALSGRMHPSSGTAAWGRDARIGRLRQCSALIDAPEVNAPESHLRVRDLVTEDLALMPRQLPFRTHAKTWIAENGFDHLAGLWVDELDPTPRLELLSALALANPAVDLLVFDSPDRHGSDPDLWMPLVRRLTGGERALTVVATVTRFPEEWTGRTAVVGQAAGPRTEATDTTSSVPADDAADDTPVADAAPTAAHPETRKVDLP